MDTHAWAHMHVAINTHTHAHFDITHTWTNGITYVNGLAAPIPMNKMTINGNGNKPRVRGSNSNHAFVYIVKMVRTYTIILITQVCSYIRICVCAVCGKDRVDVVG